MIQLDGRNEHRDMHSTYVLWELDDGSNVVFLHKEVLNNIVYGQKRFIDWLMIKPWDECCRMISRTLLASLRYKPDYIVLVSDDDSGAPYASGLSMSSMLKSAEGCAVLGRIQALAEGRTTSEHTALKVENNLLGSCLARLCSRLADRGFFSDALNRVKYGRKMPVYDDAITAKVTTT
jgi:hypothetical protein